MCGRRDSGLFWGIFFIIGGLFWLGKKANWFPAEWLEMFWPGVLIFIGVWIITSALMRRDDRRLNE
jgi:TRAP-type C4-dicarboxylate transport system permease small subunit